MSGQTPAQAAAHAFISGCVQRGITASMAVVPPEGQLATVRGLWADVAQAAVDAATEGTIRALGFTLADVARFIEAQAGAAQEPQAAPELATLRALRRVTAHFADTWDELMTSLPDDYGCEMNCAEANAAADLYRALGLDATAQAIIAAHAAHDDDEDREAHREDAP